MLSNLFAPWSIIPRILQTGVCLFLICHQLDAAEQLVLEVREGGGFRRHEAVGTLLTLPRAVSRTTPFRLMLDGAAVGAQFRPAGDGDQTAEWWLDFSSVLSPHEKRTYVVEYGSGVQPVPEATRGHVLRETSDAFVIENAPYITWTVPRDLTGLLRSVSFPPNEHIKPGSAGLVIKDRAGGRHPLGGRGVQARVMRNGTRAVALQFNGRFDEGSLAGVKWTADLTFPSPVSWVDVVTTVDDPDGKVAGIGSELSLPLDPPKGDAPTLVDFGAWTFIYAALYPAEVVEMQAARVATQSSSGRCSIVRGKPDNLLPYATNDANQSATGAAKSLLPAPEGWLHVMDRQRCLALAVDRFAEVADERLTVTAEGDVRIWREYNSDAMKSPKKELRCWLHFVHYPPQFSAATSPRMMQTPSIVQIKK